METNEMQVSRNIKSAREKFGKTQGDIATAINISRRTYIKIENNPFKYPIDYLIQIAKVIGCNIDEFFLQY